VIASNVVRPKTHAREPTGLPDDWVRWIEPGLELEGKMKVTVGLIHLMSHFKGEIVSGGVVVVHDQAEVEGKIQSKVVRVIGKVKGTVHATERVEIKEKGSVLGDIYTPCLLVDPGGFFQGQCHMRTLEPTNQVPKSVDSRAQA
jgi:cytoskeletal protein CcmA (bactofilin family)